MGLFSFTQEIAIDLGTANTSLDKGVNVGASKRKLGSRVKLTAFSG